MALTPGSTVVGTTTINALIASVYQRGTSLAANPTLTVIDPNTIFGTWSGSTAQIEIRFNPRPVAPDTITL